MYLWFAAVTGFLVRSWWLHQCDYGVKILYEQTVLALNVRKLAVGKTLRASCCMPVSLKEIQSSRPGHLWGTRKSCLQSGAQAGIRHSLDPEFGNSSKKSGWGSFEIGG